jgi:hypothetical protein
MRLPETSDRHAKMTNAATWLAQQGFASIGWADVRDGKAPSRTWKADATDDPALVPGLLHGARNALVIPKGRAIIVDIDDPAVWDGLTAAGLPETFTVDSPTGGHGHIYGRVPDGVDLSTIPGEFGGGEIRRWSPLTQTASMVLGPWARSGAGIYRPRDGARWIAELPESVLDYLRSLAPGPGCRPVLGSRTRRPGLEDHERPAPLARGAGSLAPRQWSLGRKFV